MRCPPKLCAHTLNNYKGSVYLKSISFSKLSFQLLKVYILYTYFWETLYIFKWSAILVFSCWLIMRYPFSTYLLNTYYAPGIHTWVYSEHPNKVHSTGWEGILALMESAWKVTAQQSWTSRIQYTTIIDWLFSAFHTDCYVGGNYYIFFERKQDVFNDEILLRDSAGLCRHRVEVCKYQKWHKSV